MARATRGARRRGRPRGGSDRLVQTVLAATLDQLGAAGYAELSIDAVARAAKVNKTIYRRWRTKTELVIAAVVASRDATAPFAETGSLAADLSALLRLKARTVATPRQRSIACAVIALDRTVRTPVVAELRRRRYAMPRDVVDRAIARGELPADTDAALVTELLLAPIFYRALVLRERVPDQLIDRAVALVLAGARQLRKRR
jgi:AcrR family transcriptional regulator